MIELRNVCKTYKYGKSNSTEALKLIDLSIKKGEMTAITGPSGTGKSTLLHVIGGLCNIQCGEYTFEGTNIAALSDSKKANSAMKKSELLCKILRL